MAKAKTNASSSSRKGRPALTPEARENQMIALAVDLAEQQLLDGTATSQVITHYLKLGSTKERLEKEKLEKVLCQKFILKNVNYIIVCIPEIAELIMVVRF